MNRKIGILFLIAGILIYALIPIDYFVDINFHPLFVLFFAVFVCWGSIAELIYYFSGGKKNLTYRMAILGTIAFPVFHVTFYWKMPIERINETIEFWTIAALVFFMYQMAMSFKDKHDKN